VRLATAPQLPDVLPDVLPQGATAIPALDAWVGRVVAELPLPPVASDADAPAIIDTDASEVEPQPAVRTTTSAPSRAIASERIVIPRIRVDAPVEDVALSGKEWPVPRFAVGHLAETPRAGAAGNAVFAGHLTSIASGNVFSRLSELEAGDEVAFISAGAEHTFHVVEKRLVGNRDVSVLGGGADRKVATLITCAGRWVPAENDYDQRLVVVAEA
jgi:LPXTG-site transpeptidase (sortase) family protein